MKHNNKISDVHRSKHYITRTRTWFNQPGRKRRRRLARVEKAKAALCRPVDRLKPHVKCPAARHHAKSKIGRGFSVEELKQAGIIVRYAPTIGISVDRRRNTCRQGNIDLLKTYQSKVVVFPKSKVPENFGPTQKKVATKPSNKPVWEEASL